MLQAVLGTALNLASQIDFAEAYQKPLKTTVFSKSVRDNYQKGAGMLPGVGQVSEKKRYLSAQSAGNLVNDATDETVEIGKNETNYLEKAKGLQDENKNNWISPVLETAGSLLGGFGEKDSGGSEGSGGLGGLVSGLFSKLAMNGVKEPSPNPRTIVDWRRIKTGNYKKETVPVDLGSGLALAKKGEVEVDLKDQNGVMSKAILNASQWRDYLGGKDINDVLEPIPSINDKKVAEGGLDGYVEEDTYGYPKEKPVNNGAGNTDLTQNQDDDPTKGLVSQLGKAIKGANIKTALGNEALGIKVLMENAKKNKIEPFQAQTMSPTRVSLRRPTFNLEREDVNRGYRAGVRELSELGQGNMLPALFASYARSLDQISQNKSNADVQIGNAEAEMNMKSDLASKEFNANSRFQTDYYNKLLMKDKEKADQEKRQKSLDTLRDMISTASTLKPNLLKNELDIRSQLTGIDNKKKAAINGQKDASPTMMGTGTETEY